MTDDREYRLTEAERSDLDGITDDVAVALGRLESLLATLSLRGPVQPPEVEEPDEVPDPPEEEGHDPAVRPEAFAGIEEFVAATSNAIQEVTAEWAEWEEEYRLFIEIPAYGTAEQVVDVKDAAAAAVVVQYGTIMSGLIVWVPRMATPPDTVPAEPKDPAPPPAQHTGVSLLPMKPVILGYDATARVAAYSRAPGLEATLAIVGKTSRWPMMAREVHGVVIFEEQADDFAPEPGDVIEVRAGDRTIRQTVGKLGGPLPNGMDMVRGEQIGGDDLVRNGPMIYEDCEIVGTLNLRTGVKAWLRNPTANGIDRLFQRKTRARDSYEVFVEGGTITDCGDCFGFLNAVVGTTAKGQTSGDLYTHSYLAFGNHCDLLKSDGKKHPDQFQLLDGDAGENYLQAGNTIDVCHAQPVQFEEEKPDKVPPKPGARVKCIALVNNVTLRPDPEPAKMSGVNWFGRTEGLTVSGCDYGRKIRIGGTHINALAIGNNAEVQAVAKAAGWAVR